MKKLEKTLLICDASDGGGKTKLCNHLTEKYRFNYYHCGVQPDIKQYHSDVLDLIFEDIKKYKNNWIIDRLHLSEEVYGNIFRNGASYDWKELNRKIIERCKEEGITYHLIMCIPPKDNVVNTHSARNAEGNEMFNTVEPVYDAYLKIYEENKSTNEFNIYRYNYTEDGDYIKLDEYLEKDA